MKSIILWFHSSLVKWSIFSALTYSRQVKPNIFFFRFLQLRHKRDKLLMKYIASKFYRASISQDIFDWIRKSHMKLKILGVHTSLVIWLKERFQLAKSPFEDIFCCLPFLNLLYKFLKFIQFKKEKFMPFPSMS